MTHDDMTSAEVLKDPLIRQMMRADGVSFREMKKLLQDAAGLRWIPKEEQPSSRSARTSATTGSPQRGRARDIAKRDDVLAIARHVVG